MRLCKVLKIVSMFHPITTLPSSLFISLPSKWTPGRQSERQCRGVGVEHPSGLGAEASCARVRLFNKVSSLCRSFDVFLHGVHAGHKLLWEKAGILHRDVSAGNILIVEKQGSRSFHGFIHDFDYSSMAGIQPAFEMALPNSTRQPDEDALLENLKERTVSDVDLYDP